MVRSYIAKCEACGVSLITGRAVTAKDIEAEQPDAVILATGSNPLILPIPGIEDTGVVHAGDLLDGKIAAGKKVLVVGGMVGCEGVTGATVTQFFTDGVSYALKDGTEGRLSGFDTVVLAMGYRNNDPLSEEVKKLVKETYVIGDAVKARKALDATEEALHAAMQI